mmetsp:Transcript_13555/g.56721  ORF Transcript_13555/g.56721 Transcript_13555/m.56721 type:complete len:259 (-) Transcript_13555:354-1130(-)
MTCARAHPARRASRSLPLAAPSPGAHTVRSASICTSASRPRARVALADRARVVVRSVRTASRIAALSACSTYAAGRRRHGSSARASNSSVCLMSASSGATRTRSLARLSAGCSVSERSRPSRLERIATAPSRPSSPQPARSHCSMSTSPGAAECTTAIRDHPAVAGASLSSNEASSAAERLSSTSSCARSSTASVPLPTPGASGGTCANAAETRARGEAGTTAVAIADAPNGTTSGVATTHARSSLASLYSSGTFASA